MCFDWIFRRKMQKYKSLPVKDSAAVYSELVDNHVGAPQPCKYHIVRTLFIWDCC